MLSQYKVFANIGVKNLGAAKEFYGDKLGLSQIDGNDAGGITYKCGGDTVLFVYETEYGGTNKATTATWEVSDIESVVDDLKSKGVTFENYDMPNVTKNGDIHIFGTMMAAWFKDPDGNILCVHENG